MSLSDSGEGPMSFRDMYGTQEDIIKQVFDYEGKEVENTLIECLESLLNRVPTNDEVWFYGKGVVNMKTRELAFYYNGTLLFAVKPVVSELGVVESLIVKKFI